MTRLKLWLISYATQKAPLYTICTCILFKAPILQYPRNWNSQVGLLSEIAYFRSRFIVAHARRGVEHLVHDTFIRRAIVRWKARQHEILLSMSHNTSLRTVNSEVTRELPSNTEAVYVDWANCGALSLTSEMVTLTNAVAIWGGVPPAWQRTEWRDSLQ